MENVDNNTWLIIGGLSIILLFFKPFRDLVRWIIFLPLSFMIGYLFNIIGIIKNIAFYFIGTTSSTLSFISDIVSIIQDCVVIGFAASMIAPSQKIGSVIAALACIGAASYNVHHKNVYSVIAIWAEPDRIFDLNQTLILAAISIVVLGGICFVMFQDRDERID